MNIPHIGSYRLGVTCPTVPGVRAHPCRVSWCLGASCLYIAGVVSTDIAGVSICGPKWLRGTAERPAETTLEVTDLNVSHWGMTSGI
jgi:hypothetical protein